VFEALLHEVDLDLGYVADARDAVALQARRQHEAGASVDLALLVEGVAEALDDASMALAAGERGGRDAAGGEPAGDPEGAHLAEPRVDLDLAHVHGAGAAAAHLERHRPAHRPAHDDAGGTCAGQRPRGARGAVIVVRSPGHRAQVRRGGEPLGPADRAAGVADARLVRMRVSEPEPRCGVARELLAQAGDGLEGGGDDRRGRPAAARGGAADLARVADPDLDLGRVEPERATDDARQHAPASGADVLRRGRGEQTPGLDAHLGPAVQLVDVDPVAGGDADSAPVAPALRAGRQTLPPQFERLCPAIQPLPQRVGVEAAAQRDRVFPEALGRLVDGLLERPGGDRRSGAAKRRAGRHVVQDVVVDQLHRGCRVDEAADARDRRADRHAGVGLCAHLEGAQPVGLRENEAATASATAAGSRVSPAPSSHSSSSSNQALSCSSATDRNRSFLESK
jgi:hypothetical protein